MNNSIDVTIYVSAFCETISNDAAFQSAMLEDYGIENYSDFLSTLFTDIETLAYENFEEHGAPELDYDQFFECCQKAVINYYLESLQDEGKIQAVFDEESSEIAYQLTPAARDAKFELINSLSTTNWN